MELEVTATQELVSSKKSIPLKPSNQGNEKVILVKHYVSPFGKKENKLKAAFIGAPSKALKRKSLELAAAKENSDQYAPAKRRRSIQLGECRGTSNIKALEGQNFRVNHCPCLENNTERMDSGETNILYVQSEKNCQAKMTPPKKQGTKGLDSQRDALLLGEWDDGHDTVLLPEEWSDQRYEDNLFFDPHSLKRNELEASLLVSDQESTQVESNTKCKSLFQTYRFNKVQKSIIDEV